MLALHAAQCEHHAEPMAVTVEGAQRQRWITHTLRAAPYDAHTHVPPSSVLAGLSKSAAPTATINVTYNGFPNGPQAAFQFAVDIWETHVASSVPINVSATWRGLDDGVLGSAGASFIDASENYLPRQDTWYPIALAESFAGRNLTGTDADILASFNSDFPNWYFGTDGKPPAGKYDFATVVLHEIGHGLGFFDGFGYDDGDNTNGDECPTVGAGFGCAGIQGRPVIFDRFLRDANGNPLYDPAGRYPTPSVVLGDALRAPIRFDGTTIRLASGDIPVDLYAPVTFESGSSIAHLDEAAFPAGHPSSLMTPRLAAAESIFSPGALTCALFRDLGWTLGPDCEGLLGVDVLDFTAQTTGDDVKLTFRTGGQTTAVRIEVEQQYFDQMARVVETVAVAPGETYTVTRSDLTPGRYRFRLRVVEAGGAVLFGPEVEAVVALRDLFVLSPLAPNPFQGEASATLQVKSRQRVVARLYDVTGRLVTQLLNSELAPNTLVTLRLSGGDLASGVYLLRVVGQEFAETRQVVVVR